MANIIIPKRSTVAGKVPVTGDLVTGEIAINLTDKKLYSKDGSGAIVEIGGGSVDLLNVTTGIASPDYIQFDTSATNTAAVGKLYWDAGEGSFLYTLSGGNVTQNLHPGSELVYNGTGAALTKGQVVYLSGAQGQRPSVALAIATSDATSARTIGIVAETITNGAEGWIRTYGILEGFDTSSFAAGSQLYLSGTTAGAMTATKPVAPIHLVYTARVIKSHATAGRILVGIQNGYELDEIHDVAISAPSTGQTIVYNSTTSLWSNGTLPVAGGGTGATSLTSGYLVKGNGTSAVSASVIYDNGTNVGIGTNSPATYSGYTILDIDNSTNGGLLNIKKAGTTIGYINGSSGMLLLANSTDLKLSATGAKTIQFLTNGSERARFDSSGNFGIGTTAPNAQLHLSFSPPVSIPALGSGVGALALGPAANYGMLLGTISDGSGYIQQQRFDGTTTVYPLALQPNGGNVGIGTSSPSSKFHVSGVAVSTGNSDIIAIDQNSVSTGFYSSLAFRQNSTSIGARITSGNPGSYKGFLAFETSRQTVAGTTTIEAMRINEAGNVGIGTSSPSFALQVETNTDANAGAFVRNSNTGASASGTVTVASGVGNIFMRAHSAANSAWPSSTLISSDSGFTGGLNILQAGANPIRFWTNGSERMRIDSSGNVGIGTTSPAAPLDVVGTARAGNFRVNGGGSVTGAGMWGVDNALAFNVSSTERMRIDSSGLVGVGTASPATRLHVYSGGTDEVARFESTGNPYISLYDTNVRQAYLYSSTATVDLMVDVAKDLKFGTNGTERMRIDSSGRVGIGTTSPSYKLDVQQSTNDTTIRSYTSTAGAWLQAHSATAGYAGVKLTSGTANWSAGMTYGNSTYCISYSIDGSSNRFFTIDTSGNVGIGTSSPSAKLHIVGDINLDDISVRDTATVTTTATTQVALATFSATTYDSAEVVIKAKQGTSVHITKLLIVSDGTTASSTEFGTVLTGSSLFTTDVDVSSGSVRVLITPASATSTVFKASYELITA